MNCGQSSPPLPIAIQCISVNEAKCVTKTLQTIVNSLPPNPDSIQLLDAFDDGGFYAVVTGSPPGIHQTSESANQAEGSFKYPIHRHTQSFCEVLAFFLVKGINEHMLPLLMAMENLDSTDADDESVDVLAYMLHHMLNIISDTSNLPSPANTVDSSSHKDLALVSGASFMMSQTSPILPSISLPFCHPLNSEG
ncbi:hypothetical protein J3A83DRAFT_4191256 [Scleroderma citrinum]